MYVNELRERAGLLLRLGYPASRALLRLRTNVAWDFELAGRPAHLARITKIVDDIYARKSTGGAPTP
jgi:hypothetical protein